jgi:hypothetical protein
MKTKNIIEINKLIGLDLYEILENWEDYDTNTVLLAYCQLEKNNFAIPKSLHKNQLSSFCKKNNVKNITELINSFLKEKKCFSYEEFLERSITLDMKNSKDKNSINKVIDPFNIVAAGKAIKSVVYTFLIMITVVSISLLIAIDSKESDIYIFSGLFSLACHIIILYKLYSAGNKLEKSVKDSE